MLRLDDVRDRLALKVPALDGRIGNAAELSLLIERNQMPTVTPYAFVVPGGFTGRPARAVSGFFIQDFDEAVWIALFVRVAADPSGSKALEELTPLVRQVVVALCGWGPEDAPGIFELTNGQPAGSQAGSLAFHLEFTLQDQLRITP